MTMTAARSTLAAAVIAIGVVVGTAAPASAQIEGPCTATLNGEDVATATSPASAIEVAHDATVTVAGTDDTGAPFTRIDLRFPPLPDITVHDEPNDGGTTWGGSVDVADYATWGVGLYQVSGGTDDCDGRAWIRVTGRSPFTTVAGGVGLALAAAGLVGAGRTLRTKRPGFGTLLRSLVGAAPLGVGAAVLAQQMAITPLTGTTLAGWTAGAASVSGLANLGINALRAGSAAA
jgi:hypothetical protein